MHTICVVCILSKSEYFVWVVKELYGRILCVCVCIVQCRLRSCVCRYLTFALSG